MKCNMLKLTEYDQFINKIKIVNLKLHLFMNMMQRKRKAFIED